MSARQVLLTTDALLRDGALGFVATLAALLVASPPTTALQSATNITRLRPRDSMQPTTGPRLSLQLRTATADVVQPAQRDGHVELAARYETFEANDETLELQVAYAASALAKVLLDNLRTYSDAHGGTVVDVENPLSFVFGQFDGPVAAGFIATIVITERSSE